MIIVGGAYSERVSHPYTDEFYGSGIKAAAALADLSEITLHTVVSKDELAVAKNSCNTYGFKAEFTNRTNPIAVSYVTPLAKPMISGCTEEKIDISVKGETILLFGMLESQPQITADFLIIDPQSPTHATIAQLTRNKATNLAIVLNRQEAALITDSKDPEISGPIILQKTNAQVVVVKHGALGALVVEKQGLTWIGAHPTSSVWSIGSGDVFSAIFAWAWGEKKLPPVDAAKLASAGTAIWCNTRVLPLPKDFSQWTAKLAPMKKKFASPPCVYIAGPFFTAAQIWLVEVVKTALENLGADTFSPLHDVGIGQDEVATKDLAGLAKCTSMIALLDGEDSGTLFEVGYAHAKNIPVVGFTAENKSPSFKMLRGTGIEVHSELSTAMYRAIWASK